MWETKRVRGQSECMCVRCVTCVRCMLLSGTAKPPRLALLSTKNLTNLIAHKTLARSLDLNKHLTCGSSHLHSFQPKRSRLTPLNL